MTPCWLPDSQIDSAAPEQTLVIGRAKRRGTSWRHPVFLAAKAMKRCGLMRPKTLSSGGFMLSPSDRFEGPPG